MARETFALEEARKRGLRLEPYKDWDACKRSKSELSTEATQEAQGETFPKYVFQCVRCSTLAPLVNCSNCTGTSWGFCVVRGRGNGIYCTTCEIGKTRWECPECGTDNPVTKTLGHLEEERGGSLGPVVIAIIVIALLYYAFVAS